MAIIKVERFKHAKDSTLGRLCIAGIAHCFTLEDQHQDKKVYAETRIPDGTYQIKLRTEGSFHAKYKNRFADIHKGMLHITNVPGFEYILIHCGNTDDDTAGCLLVGTDWRQKKGEYVLIDSTNAYRKIYKIVSEMLIKGEKVFISIISL